MNASSKLTDLIRARGAFEVEEPTATDLAGFQGVRQALVVTFKKSGEAMPSPMNFGLGDDRKLYFRTDASLGKVKRIRHNPRVLVVPCQLRGLPRGAVVETTARILPVDEHEHTFRVITANYSKAMAAPQPPVPAERRVPTRI